MTFKYSLTIPATGGNKLARFKAWADEHLQTLEYRLPAQTPIKTETLTIRLKSKDEGERVLAALPGTLP